ncbi:serine hydrolase [Mycolicibacterium thermoresistibile]
MLLAGCADAQPPTSPLPTARTPTNLPPPMVPARALPDNAVHEAVLQLDRLAENLMAQSGIPGLAVAVVRGGETVYAKGFGVKSVETDESVTADTVFQLASLSKPVGATVVAHQVGTGAIGWDTPIITELPWFALSDPVVTDRVTIGDMYAHRSGLPDHAGDLLEDLGYDRRAVLERLRELPLAPFRISYAYTNFGITAAAEAVATNAELSWAELSEQVLYQPLGMESTSSRFADYESRPDRAVGHIHVDDSYQPLYTRNPDAESPAGGVSSSVNDMARWLAMVLANGTFEDRQIVAPEALLPALSPQIVSSPPTEPAMRAGFYGYGFNVSTTSGARTVLSHSGAFELGTGTNFVILPSADVAIVALTNATPSGVAEALTAQFVDLVQFGEIRQDWYQLYRDTLAPLEEPQGSLVGAPPPVDPAPPAPLSEYVGTYHNDYWGPARVTERDGELVVTLGPEGWQGGPPPGEFVLNHRDGNVFTFTFVSENAPPGTISTAIFDGDRLTLEYFDANHNGVFVK